MMNTAAARPLYRAEFFLLLVLVAALPAFEAPKNIAWLAWVLLWLTQSARTGLGLQGWRVTDTVFAGFIATAAICVALCAPWPAQWGEAIDVLRYCTLGWLLSRTRLTTRQTMTVLLVAAVATVATASVGLWQWKVTHSNPLLELNSVGHVNHSALYMAMVAAGAFVATLAAFRQHALKWKILCSSIFALLGWLVLIGESRGAAIALAVSVLLMLLVFAHRQSLRIWPVLLVLAALSAAALWTTPYLIAKTQDNIKVGNVSSYRLALIATALEDWRQKPFTGIGPGNFGLIKEAQVKQWVSARGEVFEPTHYFFSSHGHNLYFNTLAERGALGVAALFALLLFWVRALATRLPAAGDSTAWITWGAGAAALGVTVVAGLFNTSLHHEHGLLAMLGLGLLLGSGQETRGHIEA